jgi:hypothetical protein
MKKTAISKLQFSEKDTIEILFEPNENDSLEDLIENFHNDMESFANKKLCFLEIYKRNNELAHEQIINLSRHFDFAGGKNTKEFMYFLLDNIDLDIYSKIELTLVLYNIEQNNVIKYFIQILETFGQMKTDIRPSIIIYIDILRYLVINKEIIISKAMVQLIQKRIDWLLGINQINEHDANLDPNFIFNTIISFQKDKERKIVDMYLDYFYIKYFLTTTFNNHKIYCSQYILQKITPINLDNFILDLNLNNLSQIIEKSILDIAENNKLSYNIRADSADLLLRLGSKNYKNEAKKVITELGKINSEDNKLILGSDRVNSANIYLNNQNIHNDGINESTDKFLLSIGSNVLFEKFENIVKELIIYIKEFPKLLQHIDKINSSLLRIKIDQLTYAGSQTLSSIFIRIYQMLIKHNEKDMLLNRLIEELIDMHDTCSSGHVIRLVNVFSGVDNFNMNIGFKTQIQANVLARIESAIKKIKNDKERELIYDQLIEESEMQIRPEFLKFFTENIGSIHDELYKEFVTNGHIKENEFYEYYRGALSFFDTGVNV